MANPFLVNGSALNSSVNKSNKVLFDLLDGGYPAIMSLAWDFVDVRDVAPGLAQVKAELSKINFESARRQKPAYLVSFT